MYGAIIGDIVGSKYEFNATKDKNFELFPEGCSVTDDSVMTVAVAETCLAGIGMRDINDIIWMFQNSMQKWGRKYPHAGYGSHFYLWLHTDDPHPYGSYGNGSAMRISPVAWMYREDLDTALKVADLATCITHDHPEGLKGAQATVTAICMACQKRSKDEIKERIEKEYGYDLSRHCSDIRPDYYFNVTCQGSVPEAIIAFLDGNSYEDVIREAVSLGGDADTQAAIAGSIAEAYYGIPNELIEKAKKYIPADMQEVIDRFYGRIYRKEL
jgi:ADP-ribosylglycohydrolase